MNAQRLRQIGCLLAAVFAGGLLALLLVALIMRAQSLDPLTEENFLSARRRWQEMGPDSYELEVVVRGAQAAVYRVKVEEGEVVALSHNGNPLKQRRTMGTWTVPGMFATIGADLQARQRAQDDPARAQVGQLDLSAHFDPTYGYPKRYRRIERRRVGANPDTSWEVTLFEPQTSPLRQPRSS